VTNRRPPAPAGRDGSDTALSLEEVLSAVESCTRMNNTRASTWQAPHVLLPGYRRLFGGQLLAQAIACAVAASPDVSSKVVRSVHLAFTAEGRPDLAADWSVEAVQDGSTFATRSVSVRQGERVLAAGVVSLHIPDTGPEVLAHSARPPGVPPAAALASMPQSGAMAMEVRCEQALDGLAVGPAELNVWMRAHRPPRPARSPEGQASAAAELIASQQLLAYSSDLTMMVAAMRPHDGIGYGSPSVLASAVTSHTISFHQPFAVDDWLLFAQSSPVAAGGRAYIRGDWFTAAGALVASCAQEVLIRAVPSRATPA